MNLLVSLRLLFIALIGASCLGGCSLDRQTKLLGRWYNKDVSIRFRPNGTLLYNSRDTGLVQGRYQYEPTPTKLATTKASKNLTLWLPQPGRVEMVELQVKFLGSQRIQVRPVVKTTTGDDARDLMAATGIVLKRAEGKNGDSNGLDEAQPLVSANPERSTGSPATNQSPEGGGGN